MSVRKTAGMTRSANRPCGSVRRSPPRPAHHVTWPPAPLQSLPVMTINFHPRRGTVLICDFGSTARPPEMVKRRPVVVVAKAGASRPGLCTIVPLSSTPPEPVQPWHHQIDSSVLPGKFQSVSTWAKCDMVCSVSVGRLDRIRIRGLGGQRIYVQGRVTIDDFKAIRRAILHGLDLGELAAYIV